MKIASTRIAVGVLALAIGASALRASAVEINGLSTIAMQSAMEELVPQFERASGHKVSVAFGLGVAMGKRIQEGETADFVLAPRGAIDGLVKSGRLAPGSDTSLARSSVGVAVRNGAPRPDISTPDALKRTLLAARAISYSNPAYGGASGVHFAKVLERLGISEQITPKTRFPPEGGFTARLLAAGEVDLAIQQTGELLSVPGVELLGPLPGDLQSITTFAIAIPATARQANAAKALIKYLQSPEALGVLKAKGLEPIGQP
jgi:molybdate transport system substrate-binding protein